MQVLYVVHESIGSITNSDLPRRSYRTEQVGMSYFKALILLLFVSLAESYEYYFFEEDFGGYGGYGGGDYHGRPYQEENNVPEPDYYADLGVSSTATARQIKRKFRSLALELHPDKQKEQTQETQERFQRVQTAYAVLINPEKRDAYDSTGLSTFTSRWDWVNALKRRGKRVDGTKGFFNDLDLIMQFQPYSLRRFYQQQRNPFVVDFYAPWCSHCLDAAPAIRSLAISLDAESSKVKVGAVNCEQYGSLCDEFGIHSFPTLQLFYTDDEGNRRTEVSDSHKPDEILRWIKRTTESKVVALNRHNFASAVLSSPMLYFISLTAGSWCGPCTRFKSTFQKLAYDVHETYGNEVAFGQFHCDRDEDFCRDFGAQHFPYLIMYTAGPGKTKGKFIDLNFHNLRSEDVLEVVRRLLPAMTLPSSTEAATANGDDHEEL